MSDNNAYIHVPVCESAVNNDEVFNEFKKNSDFITILEHTAVNYSYVFMNQIIDKYLELLNRIDWKLISQNDSIGGAEQVEYEELKNYIKLDSYIFSPSTVAYTYKALEILDHIKESNLNDISILEIGAGYGGQCKIILDLAPLFNINIKEYTLVDLYWPNQLQKKYLNYLGYKNNLKFISYEDLRGGKELDSFDYLISIYALGEFSPDIQQFYIDKMQSFRYHYLVWNTPNIYEKFLLSDIEEESPRTGPYNVVIKSKVNE